MSIERMMLRLSRGIPNTDRYMVVGAIKMSWKNDKYKITELVGNMIKYISYLEQENKTLVEKTETKKP